MWGWRIEGKLVDCCERAHSRRRYCNWNHKTRGDAFGDMLFRNERTIDCLNIMFFHRLWPSKSQVYDKQNQPSISTLHRFFCFTQTNISLTELVEGLEWSWFLESQTFHARLELVGWFGGDALQRQPWQIKNFCGPTTGWWFQRFVYFHPGEMIQFDEHILKKGWNYQLVTYSWIYSPQDHSPPPGWHDIFCRGRKAKPLFATVKHIFTSDGRLAFEDFQSIMWR